MRKTNQWALTAGILLASLILTACQPQSVNVPVTVVVKETQVVEQTSIGPRGYQKLNVIIDRKKLECKAEVPSGRPTLLGLGEYRAKLVEDVHRHSYESIQTYEFRLADNVTRRFTVTGQSE